MSSPTRTALTSSASQVVVLSVLDPTGLTSLLIEAGLGYALKYGGELPMSREAENEADALGLEIMARACYDVSRTATCWARLYILSRAI